MIKKAQRLPVLSEPTAQGIKVRNIFRCYPQEVYVQDEGKAFISLLDGDAVIENVDADIEELRSFLDFVKPVSLFSDASTIKKLGYKSYQKANVLMKKGCVCDTPSSDKLKSDRVYELLKMGGFKLPEYEFFATDFCRRQNMGALNCFAIKDKCLAITLIADDACLLNGIVSTKKGFGTVALNGALNQNADRVMLVCCEDNLKEFYLKNGFSYVYEAGYVLEDV